MKPNSFVDFVLEVQTTNKTVFHKKRTLHYVWKNWTFKITLPLFKKNNETIVKIFTLLLSNQKRQKNRFFECSHLFNLSTFGMSMLFQGFYKKRLFFYLHFWGWEKKKRKYATWNFTNRYFNPPPPCFCGNKKLLKKHKYIDICAPKA